MITQAAMKNEAFTFLIYNKKNHFIVSDLMFSTNSHNVSRKK